MRKAFTMVELVVVMTIIGIMAGFAIPNFTKAVNRARARDAILNLNIIHSANVLYRTREGNNIGSGGEITLALINSGLGLNVLANGVTYGCGDPVDSCTATGTGFTATLNLASALADGSNPSCDDTAIPGTCP